MVEAIDKTIQALDLENRIASDGDDFMHTYPLEDLRDYVRNVMLFKKD
jgi:hypothetical protein